MTLNRSRAARLTVLAATLALTVGAVGAPAVVQAQDKPIIGLVTKTETNPFFVRMRQTAEATAEELGVELRSCAGAFDTDNDGQITCIQNLRQAGASGILITPSVPDAIVPTLAEAQADGILVIALDTQTNPSDAADATLATDNREAGILIGQWAAAKLGEAAADAVIGFLDVSPGLQITTEVQRNNGFQEGFGIADIGDPDRIGDESDPRIAGYQQSQGDQALGRTAMELLLAFNPNINLVYTINEPAAAGANEALVGADIEGVTIVSVDGGCAGVRNVEAGIIGATSMQFPNRMADEGVRAVVQFLEDGSLPENSEGLEFKNTGVVLITDEPQEGIESESTAWGLENCWGEDPGPAA